jgi:hypothetical protein
MDLTEGSETSAKLNLTSGKYPKERIQDSEHGENLKSRMLFMLLKNFQTVEPALRQTNPDRTFRSYILRLILI